MIWIDDIYSLDYYKTPYPAPCYCEQLVYAADLVLQASYSEIISNPFLFISVYSADGLTEYEDALPYFEYYFFTYNGLQYVNMRLKSFSPAMCQYKCWILRVRIGASADYIIFDKYTQRYCQADCCDTPRGISIVSETSTGELQTQNTTLPVLPTGTCGVPLIRIETTFDCVDKQLGDYYGIPSGQTWGFIKVTNIAGKIRQKPREITRNISYSCNLQRSESFIPYKVTTPFREGTFPVWKLKELESMFHARIITVSDFEETYNFQFDGGVIAKPIGEAVCWDMYQLDATLRTCYIRQTFGCGTGCDNEYQSMTFLIPQNYAGGSFYSENRSSVGSYEQLLEWYQAQEGITNVTDVTESYENIYAAFKVEGNGYIPTQFYFDSPYPKNRVFGSSTPVSPTVICIMPEIGAISTEAYSCPVPEIGAISTDSISSVEINVQEFGYWLENGTTELLVGEGYGHLNIGRENSMIAFTSPITFFVNEPIGIIDPNGKPSQPRTILLDGDNQINIDTSGVIFYTGYPTSFSESSVTIAYTNLYYQL